MMRRRWLIGLATIAFVLPISPLAKAQAQLNRGVIEGIVTDPQGAVVPGVNITITDVDTKVSATTKSNSAGYYRVVDLVPGRYLAHFALAGFAPLDETGIQVLPGQVQRIDAALKVGATRQMVQVSAQSALLQTSPTNANTTLQSREIMNIPLSGRDLQQLVFLVPGVKSTIGPPGTTFGFNSQYAMFPDPTHIEGSDLSVNGGQAGANAWYLDGNYNVSELSMNMVVDPSPDSVDEFQAINNSFSAQYSGTGGGVFSMVLKSGTNQLHGDVYDYLLNNALNARNPFTSISSTGQLVAVPAIHYNDFGGTLGGPVVIPHVYNGKDKTFFFVSMDTTILHELGNKVFSVPTPLEKNGDFSEDPNIKYGLWNAMSTVGPNAQGLYDRTAYGTSAAGNPNGCLASQVVATSGASCTFAKQLPMNAIDPVSSFFMKSFPNPNYLDPLSNAPLAAGGAYRIADNFLGGVGNYQDTYNLSIKVDENWSDKSKYFFEWLFNPTSYGLFQVPWTGATFPQDSVGWNGPYPFDNANQIAGIGNTYVLSPTLVNEFRASYTRQFLTTHPDQPLPNSITDQSAVQAIMKSSQIPAASGYPTPYFGPISDPGGGSLEWGPTSWTNTANMAESYTILDNLTKVMGKHTITTGFMYQLEHTATIEGFPEVLGFGSGLSDNPIIGLGGGGGLSTFLQGDADNTSFTGETLPSYQRARTWGFYGQDEFHITPSFTLNLGLRYDIFGWFKTRYPVDATFCYTCTNPEEPLPGALVYTHGQDISPPVWHDLGPRVNFAWAPFQDKKTVVRGGYDIFYSNATQIQLEPGNGGGLFEPGWEVENLWSKSWDPNQCASFSGGCVAFPISNTTVSKGALAFPSVTSEFPANSKGQALGQNINIMGRTGAGGGDNDPMVQMWSLQLQRELPGSLMITAGYTGTHGTHLFGDLFRRTNYVPVATDLKYKEGIHASVPITSVYSGATASDLASLYGTSSLPLSTLLLPYPFYGPLNMISPFDGMSDYNAFNLKIEKRFSHGLNLAVAYTNSKQIDNCCVAQMASMVIDPIHGTNTVGGQVNVVGNIRGQKYQNPDDRKADRSLDTYDIPQILSVAGTYELPFGAGKSFLNRRGILNQVLGGWRLTGNFIAESGIPLGISCPMDTLQATISSQAGTASTARCNLVGNPHIAPDSSKQQQIADWINPSAFEPSFGSNQSVWANYDPTASYAWQLGNMGPVLPNYRAPGFWNLDTALTKDFHVTESKYFEFRWEAFNALNHMNLGYPNTNFCLPPTASGQTDLVHQAGCAFGRITNIQTDPRSMEFALKFYW